MPGRMGDNNRRLGILHSSLRCDAAGPENGDLSLVNVNGIFYIFYRKLLTKRILCVNI